MENSGHLSQLKLFQHSDETLMMEICEAGKLPQRSDSPASLRAKDGRHEWNGVCKKKNLKQNKLQVGFFSFVLDSGSREW